VAAETSATIDFNLPSLGSDMEAGTVIEWLVAVGDIVHKGDVLVRVDTEKADIDVETWHEGAIVEIVAEPGTTLAVGATLAKLASNSSIPATPPTESVAAPPQDQEPALTSEAIKDPFAALILGDKETMRAAPIVKPSKAPDGPAARPLNLAAIDMAVSPRTVYWPSPADRPTIAAGRAGERGSPPPRRSPTFTPLDRSLSRSERRQRKLAEVMARSNRDIPHFYLSRQIDLTLALTRLSAHNENAEPSARVLPAALLLHAVATAAQGSVVNGQFDDEPVDSDHVHLGVAVNLRGGGLATPVIPASETLDLSDLMTTLKAMVARAKAGRMTSRDMTPATMTVTNLGDTGVDRVFGVIRPPERALVGFGAIVERPTVVDGVCVPRSIVDVTLAADHRVVNGHAASLFLSAVAALLEDDTGSTALEINSHLEGDT